MQARLDLPPLVRLQALWLCALAACSTTPGVDPQAPAPDVGCVDVYALADDCSFKWGMRDAGDHKPIAAGDVVRLERAPGIHWIDLAIAPDPRFMQDPASQAFQYVAVFDGKVTPVRLRCVNLGSEEVPVDLPIHVLLETGRGRYRPETKYVSTTLTKLRVALQVEVGRPDDFRPKRDMRYLESARP